jgi:uncharacterized protein (DUF362 family)
MRLSRRGFIKIAAAMGLLSGCRAAGLRETPTLTPNPTASPTPEPIDAPAPNPTASPSPEPTDAPAPNPTATASPKPTEMPSPTLAAPQDRPEVIQTYPDVKSKVIHTHHAGVWHDDRLEPTALRGLLGASITQLTGMSDAGQAWRALFRPGERVAIKVNAFHNSLVWTHPALVLAIVDALQEAGVAAEQIVIFDYQTRELEEAGYAVNPDGPGVRCYGTDGDYAGDWDVAGRTTQLSRILMDCDALINVPIFKAHNIAGMTFAMKNHYGTIPNPQSYHSSRTMAQGMPALNALPPIYERTRLIVGDMLSGCLHPGRSYPYWEADYEGDSILMSFDPVAHDSVGLEILSELLGSGGGLANRARPWLERGAEIGLGAHAPGDIELTQLNLG